jgi:hypothetical protein
MLISMTTSGQTWGAEEPLSLPHTVKDKGDEMLVDEGNVFRDGPNNYGFRD